MIKNAYYRGFAQKCAELGVDPRKLLKLASMQKKAEGEMSVEEAYPMSLKALSNLQREVIDQKIPVHRRNSMRQFLEMTPEEYSARRFSLGSVLSDATPDYDRGGIFSLDNFKNYGHEFLQDPRFMSDAGITPAGTNLLNSVPPLYNFINWSNVDRLTGVGQSYKGRNIPLPEGFLHKSAPTNSTLEAVAPEIFAQPKK